MKRIYSLLVGGYFLSLGIMGCEGQKPMDSATMTAKADSIAGARMQMVADSMMRDCESNKAMWIQMKADSIYTHVSDSMKMSMQ